jgi:N-acetylglucosaminyldiphosphoundecaprenol N-acetyl-beta-D-mannosaminyltransferase
MSERARFEVAGVAIDAVSLSDAVARMAEWIQEGRRDYIVLTGAHGVVEMQDDAGLREINNRAGMVTADGMPLVWIGRARGFARIEKVSSPIMARAFESGITRGHRHFLYGGGPGVAERLAERARRRYPGIEIVGTHCPPFRALTAPEEQALVQAINASGADIVWCGLGCPKQERWMARFRPKLEASVLIGVGAAFDFLSGDKAHAPQWVQHAGLEWAYRALSEPRRLGARYARVVPRFAYYAATDEIRRVLGTRAIDGRR